VKRLAGAFAAGWLVLGVAAPVAAQAELSPGEQALVGPPAGRSLAGAELAARTEAVARSMRCPVCQGLSVADSHTLAAAAMRGKVERLLAAGYSESQVLAVFEASYGEFIRLSPRPAGFNLVVWAAPVLVGLAGVIVVGWRLRRARAASGEAAELETLRERIRRQAGT
jgi:cytochrome c-type biogenesis protein CcmH